MICIYNLHWKCCAPRHLPRSRNPDSSVSRGTNSKWKLSPLWICSKEPHWLDLVDFGGVAFSVDSVVQPLSSTRWYLKNLEIVSKRYIYIYTYMYTYKYICICIYVHVYIYTYKHIYTYINIYIYTCIHIYIYHQIVMKRTNITVCMYLCVSVDVCAHACVWVHARVVLCSHTFHAGCCRQHPWLHSCCKSWRKNCTTVLNDVSFKHFYIYTWLHTYIHICMFMRTYIYIYTLINIYINVYIQMYTYT